MVFNILETTVGKALIQTNAMKGFAQSNFEKEERSRLNTFCSTKIKGPPSHKIEKELLSEAISQ